TALSLPVRWWAGDWGWAPGAGVALVRIRSRWPAQSPVPQHPPPASCPSSARHVLKGKDKAKQGQSRALQSNGTSTAQAAGRGWGGAMMGVPLSEDHRYGSVLVI